MPDIRAIPSLVIGVGGTGVMVATYVKKDLLEITGTNELPRGVQVLAFDTEADNRVRVGGWGRPRQAGGHRTGAVVLDTGQYVYIGGNVKQEAQEVAMGQHRYLGTWWNAREYLGEHLADDLWNLNKGAGQYRQFGRMALFKNRDTVFRMITSAIQAIQQGVPGTTELYIHIAGSFVGGTGAGLFADIAHVASVLAKKQGISQLSVRGYFALVDAFLGTPQVGLEDPRKKSTYQAQCYASLRECSRLLTQSDWVTGYPMYYDDTSIDDLLHGKITGPLYAAVYLFDGSRNYNPLTHFRIEEGVAPTIADAVVAHVDQKSGNTFTAHTVNSGKQRTSFRIPKGVPTYGTLGTFTIVLPIFHIVEGWTHRLAKEVLDELLVPKNWDEDTHIPNGPLASNQRGGTRAETSADGAEKGREWLKKGAPTSFIKDLGELAEGYSRSATQQETLSALKSRSTETWLNLLKPEGMSAEAGDKIERATAMMESDLTKEKVKRGDQTEANEYYINPSPGGNARAQADEVATEVRKQFRVLVGEEDEDTGRRSGGRIKSALDDLKEMHIRQFRKHLLATLNDVLNGSASGADALEAKAGKLGYLIAYLTQIRDDLRQAQQAIEKTEGGQREGGASRQRRGGSRREGFETSLKEAEEKMRKSGGLLGANRKAYIATAQQYLQVLKSEIAERVARETVEELISVAQDALDQVTSWAEALAYRNAKAGGLYAIVLEGQRYNDDDRKKSAEAKVRMQVEDKEYENDKYKTYVARGEQADERAQLKKVLGEFAWEARTDENTGRIRIGLKLGTAALSADKGQNIGELNARVLLDRCRTVFDAAWDDLSILRYLMSKYGSGREKSVLDLANLIRDKSGPLLNVRGGSVLPANFLRVHQESVSQLSDSADEEVKAQKGFLEQLKNALAKLYNVAVERPTDQEGESAKFADYTDSMDRFKLSFVYFSELNQPKDITAYTSAVGDYRGYPARQRMYLHIFPAEQHAVRYESQLGQMNPPQRPRELENLVTVQLEDLDRFKFIVRCLVYGDANHEWTRGAKASGLLLYKIIPADDPPGTNPTSQAVYRLTVEPEGELRGGILIDPMSGKPAAPKHWNLTELAREPSLLDAFNQFNYKQHAFGNDQDTIPDLRVHSALQKAIELDREKRVERGLPWRPPSGWSAEKVREAETRVAQYLKYQEVMAKWQRELQRNYRDAITPGVSKQIAPEVQREADLLTVLVLVVAEEIRSLKEQIDQYGGKWIAAPTPMPEPEVVEPFPEPVSVPETPSEPVAVPAEMKCPHCGAMHPTTWKACPATGKPLEPPAPPPPQTELKCPHCGAMHPTSWKACPVTGKPLEPPVPKPTKIKCPHCGEMHPAEWKACPSTGKPL